MHLQQLSGELGKKPTFIVILQWQFYLLVCLSRAKSLILIAVFSVS